MFCNWVDSGKGYMNCKSLDDVNKIKLLCKLAYYKKMLQELENDCEIYQTHRAFRNFHHHYKMNFFELMDKYVENHYEYNLYDILHKEHSIDKHIFDYIQGNPSGDDIYFVNSYFEVLSKNIKPQESDKYSSLLKIQFDNEDKNKYKYFSLNKDMFEDIVQSSGKYILYRYISERHMENENIINFPPVLSLEEQQNIKCDDSIPELKEITISKLLERNITIPVIQRDYCMGSHFNQEDKSDMMDYIIDCFTKDKDITLSAITIRLNDKDIYIYDGQQRIFTLACLVKILDSKKIRNKITFEHRDTFNTFIKEFFEYANIKAYNYASKSVASLKEALDKKLKARSIDKDKLSTYILGKIKFDVIIVNGALTTAEQFFIEINDGVQLVPYEIFKCKINARFKQLIHCDNETSDNRNCLDIEGCPSINEILYKQWISSIDNEWLDFFYRFNCTSLENETATEELMEIRLIEFCCRMIYWEKYLKSDKKGKHPLELKSFEKYGNEMGDMDVFIEILTLNDFNRISEIVNGLKIKEINGNSTEELICYNNQIKYFNNNSLPDNDHQHGIKYIIPRFSTNSVMDNLNLFIYKFLEKLAVDELNGERSTDILMWIILNNLTFDEKASNAISSKMDKWNNTIIYDKPFAYVTPYFWGDYSNAILPVPKYYYDKSIVNIYNELHLKNKEGKDKLCKGYDNLLNDNDSIDQNPHSTNQFNAGYIFYRYSRNLFYDSGISGEVNKSNENEFYIKVEKGYKFLWRGEKKYRYFIKKVYDAYPDNVNPKKLNIDGLVFTNNNSQYYINI